MEKPLRMLMLLSGNRSYTRSEIAERFSISERSVYRYINNIENSGFVVDRSQGRYRLVRNQSTSNTLKRLLHFSEEEAFLLFRALTLLDKNTRESNRLIKKLHALYDFKALSNFENTCELEKINALGDAIQNRKQAILYQYRSSNTGIISDRKIEPFSFMEDYQAIWCFDPEDQNNKQFKIARIGRVEIIDEKWNHHPRHQIPFTDAFRMSATKALTTVDLLLTLKACNLLMEEYPLAEQFIKPEKERYRLQIPIADYHGIGRFVLGLPGETEVISPYSFIEFLNEQKQRSTFISKE